MQTKKLNAGIAFLCLAEIDQQGGVDDKYLPRLKELADKCAGCGIYNDPDDNYSLVEQCIVLIQDYLHSVSTDINIGERVEVLEDNPDDSEEYYSKGEVGIVTRMRDSTCDVNFGFGDWNTAEIPFTSLKKIVD